MTLYGIDVSHYQGTIDWPGVVKAGMGYCVAQASVGQSWVDPTFKVNRQSAQAVGLLAGAYHFLEPGSGSSQADLFCSTVGDFDGILAAVDVEVPGLTLGMVQAFCAYFDAHTGGHPLFVYANPKTWKTQLGDPDMRGLGPLWLAYYPKGGYPGDHDPTWNLVMGRQKPVLWQYGPRHIPGRPKPVDGDAYRGTLPELRRYSYSTQGGPQIPGDVMLPISNETPVLVDLAKGVQLYDLNGKALTTVSGAATGIRSDYEVQEAANRHYRVVPITTGGVRMLALIANADANVRPIPAPPPTDCRDAIAVEHEKVRAAAIKAAEAL